MSERARNNKNFIKFHCKAIARRIDDMPYEFAFYDEYTGYFHENKAFEAIKHLNVITKSANLLRKFLREEINKKPHFSLTP